MDALSFSADKALRYLAAACPHEAAPYSNTLTCVKAFADQTKLFEYSEFSQFVAATTGAKGAAEYAKFAPMHAARAAFEEKIKAFKMPEDMQEKWADLEGEWNQWLAQATAASKAIAGLLAAVKAAASLDAATAFGEKVAAAKERAHQEYLASLVVQLDARALKKAAKAAEKEKLKQEQ